jgi:MFS family permease
MIKRFFTFWLPLSLPIFGVDLIQRGFAAFAKAKDFMIPNMEDALSVYFITMSIGVLVCSVICDRANSRRILLYSCLVGGIGMVLLPHSYLAFGIIFGMAAAFIKISPFSASLKLTKDRPATNVVPQAVAKNLAGALFILLLGLVFKSLGWTTSSLLLGAVFVLSGFYVYWFVPDDRIEGWNWSIFRVVIGQFKFWHLMTYMFFMNGTYYLVVKQFYPAFIEMGIPSSSAMTMMAISLLISGAMRWPWAWAGDVRVLGPHTRVILMWGGVAAMAVPLWTIPHYPITSFVVYTFLNAIHTPTYWAYHKENWGPEYVSTIAALGFAFMYLGSGVMYGSWAK